MKVVINSCYGGFSLSPAGERAYLARQGKEAFFYTDDRDSAERPGDRDFVRVSEAEAERAFIHYTLTGDMGERVSHAEFWPKGQGNKFYWHSRELERNDPDLVAVVEEIGQKASGAHAVLSIVEIPDDVEFVIEEYDGLEHVAEAHRTWA